MKSDHILQAIALTAFLLVTGCSDGPKVPPENVPTPAEPVKIEPLTDAELMGISRDQIVMTLPWSESPLSRNPAPNAPRATLHSIDVSAGETFDRATFGFGDDAPYPGYRIVWNDSTAASCADSTSVKPPAGTLVIRFEPSTAKDAGRATVAKTSQRPALPSVETARQVCDKNDKLIWALGAADSTRFRVVELRDPPRLVVDVRHKDAGIPATAAQAPAPK